MNVPTHFSVTAIDNVIAYGDVYVPKGLILNVRLEADGLQNALDYAQQAATYFLSSLSCTCNASVGQPKPLWIYDATPSLVDRDMVLIVYDLKLHVNTIRLNQENWFTLLDQLFNGAWLKEHGSEDDTQRLQRAILSFRRGLADTDDMLDEFLVHWSALETLNVVYQKVFHHMEFYFCKVCTTCKTQVIRMGQRHTGIEEVFGALQQPGKYGELKKLRNGISHGYMSLGECIAAATENIELVRKAVLSMIMRTVGVSDDVQAIILGQSGLKGKYIPHFRVYFKGTFEPGDPCRYDTHPQVEVKDGGIEVKKYGEKLVLNPTWTFTYKNCSVKPIGFELWGDEAAKFTIEEGIRFEDV